ncbi:Mss4-like protein [Xylariaceae sp. FL0594]|nr:Mss4-like protein [Xylariaceae sp. FL0594]
MLESRIFTTQQTLSRLCSSTATATLRRHHPLYASFQTKTNNLTTSRLLTTSGAQLCKNHHHSHACNHTSEASTTTVSASSPSASPGSGSSSSKLFHTMSNIQDNRPEPGQGGGGHMQNTASKKDDDYKNRPPYRTTDKNVQFDKKYTAHCHCGRVKYWLSREKPLATKFCHCIDCQAQHGAPFQWAAVFHKEDLHFENGAEGLAFYHAPSKGTHYELPVKVRCAYCHSPILDEGRNMVLMFPGIIKFEKPEDKKLFDPQCHIFYSQRVVDLPDGKPKWIGLDNQSELMKDVESDQPETVVGKAKVEKADDRD